MCGVSWGKDDLTYVEHNPPSRASAFGNVYSTWVYRMRDDGHELALKANWGAMVVFRFAGLAANFLEGMTGDRLEVRMSLTTLVVVVGGKRRGATLFGRSDLRLKIETFWQLQGVQL